MATNTTYQRIVLTMNHPWNYLGDTSHDWHLSFHLSGGTPLTNADAELTGLDLFDPVRQLSYAGGHLKTITYYPMGSTTASWVGTYAANAHPTTGSFWTTPAPIPQQLEVCYLAECPIGKNSRGKEVYLRKWIHGAGNTAADHNSAPASWNTALLNWNQGSGPRDLVPVGPTTGVQGGPWVGETHLFTHQLRRGPKRKVTKETVYVPVPIP